MKIGAKIRDLRKYNRITLKELAKRTKLTTSFLSQIERNLASPSVKSLETIVEALNEDLGHFFGREKEKELIFVKKGMGKKSVDKKKKISHEVLASGALSMKMRPHIFALGADAELTKELRHPSAEIFGLVLKGKLEMSFDTKKLIMKEGDSICCVFAHRPHRVVNIGKADARLLWIVSKQA
jgi:transcriptional regulator with XRE-family HTH domain